MLKQTPRILLSALFAVPFMLGNRGCEDKPQTSKPGDDDGSSNESTSGDTPTDGADVRSDADERARDAGAATGEKLPTCEAIECGALPRAPTCADGDDAHPSCLLHDDGSCAWKFSCGGVDSPDAGADPSAFCGGLSGKQCEDGQYCNLTGCNVVDQGGKCAPIPQSCSFEYNPICGCDNKTYSNPCAAATAGMSVAGLGACDDPQPCSSCTGPVPGAPNYQCKDGFHVGGPACVALPDAKCGWQFLKCPEEPP